MARQKRKKDYIITLIKRKREETKVLYISVFNEF